MQATSWPRKPRETHASKASRKAKGAGVSSSRFAAEVRELTALSRALKTEEDDEKDPSKAYDRMSRFAERYAKDELGERAALALAYYDYNDGRYTQARHWLDIAKPEQLLGDYVLFYSAQVDRNLNNNAAALNELQTLRTNFPQSVLSNLALQAQAETALAANQPQVALDVLATVEGISSNPALLFLRAEAHEQANDQISAAGDYLTVYDKFPLSTQAQEAGEKVKYLQSVMGATFPQPPLADQLTRADKLFAIRHWQDAEDAYNAILSRLQPPDQQQANLRIAECKVQLGANPSELTAMKMDSLDLDAERLFYLSSAYRSLADEQNMLAAVAKLQAQAPQSIWTEHALFGTGNYYWVKLDRDNASKYYQQLLDEFPSSDDATNAEWRVAWTAYLERKPEEATLLGNFLHDHPDSGYVPDVLYWLGRTAQRQKHSADARAYFSKLRERFPNNYFAQHARRRLVQLGRGRIAKIALLDAIPHLSRPRRVLQSEPAAAQPFVHRSIALETIALDDAALAELHAAYDLTGSAALEFTIARAATRAEHYSGAIVAMRNVYPAIESRPFAAVPREVWHYSFPLAYSAFLRRDSRRAHVDPMLVTGLIHQESAFDKNAHSYADAVGLMQLLADTAQRIARQTGVKYSDDSLTDPAFNIRVGVAYFAGLLKMFHSDEAALAAYNAGEDHVAQWQSGQKYSELPEFVESIPFTQTREYVEIVMRNAAIYRALYGAK